MRLIVYNESAKSLIDVCVSELCATESIHPSTDITNANLKSSNVNRMLRPELSRALHMMPFACVVTVFHVPMM